jgi:hypothetical protein
MGTVKTVGTVLGCFVVCALLGVMVPAAFGMAIGLLSYWANTR